MCSPNLACCGKTPITIWCALQWSSSSFSSGTKNGFAYEVQRLIPFISNGPLIFWLYPVLGVRGATLFLGVSEWTFGTLLFLGFWSSPAGILGALGSVGTFVATVTIIPFMPEGWDVAAGGFPAMTGNVPFLMKDVVLLAVPSIC
jgi:uncharacterized membrane protein YkgB